MGSFDYNSFDNLAQMFACRRGFARERVLPQVLVQPEVHKVVWYALAGQHLASSKFANLKAFRPSLKPRFMPFVVDLRAPKPEVVQAQQIVEKTSTVAVVVDPVAEESKPRSVLKLKAKMDVAAAAPQQASAPIEVVTEAARARSVLKLKSKVELPAAVRISRHSSTEDLAAAFKAEMRQMKLAEEGVEATKRHPLSHKTWAELLAEASAAEAPAKPKYNIDLASAFKAEMQALAAKGTVDMDMLMSAPRPRAAFEPKVVSQTAMPQRRSTAKVRILAA